MPYKRRYTKRRTYRRRGAKTTNWSKYLPYAVKGVRFLSSIVNAEKKFIDTGVVSTTYSNSGTVVYLSGVAQGNDQASRNGNSIKAMYQYVRGSIVINASASTTIVRMILFRDNDNAGSSPSVGDVLSTADVNSQLSQFNGKRFTILTDRCFNVDNTNRKTISYTIYRKLGFHIKYGGSSAVIGNQKENGMFMLIISNETVNFPSVAYNSRIRFIDN